LNLDSQLDAGQVRHYDIREQQVRGGRLRSLEASKGSTNDRASNPLLIKINSKVDAMILSSSTTNTIERLG
jgi:hypothetical protein